MAADCDTDRYVVVSEQKWRFPHGEVKSQEVKVKRKEKYHIEVVMENFDV
jgi:hypothetical protein